MTLSIHGLGGVLPDPIGRPRDDARDVDIQRGSEEAAGTAARDTFVASGDTPSAQGVDPQLWSVLSTEERTWYLRGVIAGPATYEPRSAGGSGSEQTARLGARLDVRA